MDRFTLVLKLLSLARSQALSYRSSKSAILKVGGCTDRASGCLAAPKSAENCVIVKAVTGAAWWPGGRPSTVFQALVFQVLVVHVRVVQVLVVWELVGCLGISLGFRIV